MSNNNNNQDVVDAINNLASEIRSLSNDYNPHANSNNFYQSMEITNSINNLTDVLCKLAVSLQNKN